MRRTRSSPTRKILLWTGLTSGLLTLLYVIGRSAGWIDASAEAIEVQVESVSRRDITQVVSAAGKVRPEIEVKITPDVSGEIIALYVKEGDRVRQGQLLARIKPDFYQAQAEQSEAALNQMRALLAQARAQLLKAETDFQRAEALYRSGVVSEADYQTIRAQYESARAQYESAQFQVKSAQARLREAQSNLRKTYIYAPISGTVSQLSVELGERVVGTSQMAGTEMMRVALLDQMEVLVEINENDIVHVSEGDTALIEVDAYPNMTFVGQVTNIANSAKTTLQGTVEQVTTYPVRIRINGSYRRPNGAVSTATLKVDELPPTPMPRLRPGMSATVDIRTRTVRGALAVPIQAVTVRSRKTGRAPSDTARAEEQLERVVFVVESQRVRQQPVETGINDDRYIEITSGLRGDERVVVGPFRAVNRLLKDGSRIRINPTQSPSGQTAAATRSEQP
ncbi:MAG: efflux RND transporter periplasmic adaptor subunit [Bacteroidetes bacterium]|nr:efflux RND transporter periplasmic adaptor subunit [Rhodothermia bacterium]MCS7155300.1 efflux RND transporter periplasmic adaptor subunit [Bacteroidota bacterium]MCX7907885.1 efflux RND transporter periplasmic adaptor subunit [Bacteroidota bacterium]MDW8138704.1 efflux RND transporter periplasmic adaptor subunit [Bacteroidota bacterium]MDW8284710.1 efflux RND transporter periplasmic adaptor subunit [Bacteroidota bacterium]